jgi:signal recognition particle subunit SEC65
MEPQPQQQAPAVQTLVDPSTFKRWKIIYPAYINSKKTIAEGRKISAEKGVEAPTVVEIVDVASKHFGFECVVEVLTKNVCVMLEIRETNVIQEILEISDELESIFTMTTKNR